jgi:U3 small nucleolar RNA-associated protein 21
MLNFQKRRSHVLIKILAHPSMQQEVEERPAKRIRSEKPKTDEVVEPRLFAPFRALGLVTNQIPFVLQTRSYKGSSDGPKVHLLTCLGKSWSLWDAGKMTLLFVGE